MKKFIKVVKSFFNSTPRLILTLYLFFGIVGALLLLLPISRYEQLSFIDSLFISFSSISDTGLTPVVISNVFTPFGLVVIMFLLLIGGMGIFMFFIWVLILFGKKIGQNERNIISQEQNQTNTKGILRHVKWSILIILLFQLFCGVILTFIFFFDKHYEFSFMESILHGFFMSISFYTNAGVESLAGIVKDIFINKDYHILFIGMIEMFTGGLGIIVIFGYLLDRTSNSVSKYVGKSLILMHLIIFLVSGVIYFALEYNGSLSGYNLFDKIVGSYFMSLSSRSSGFTCLDAPASNSAGILFLMILMFIGSNPNSVGGGIRTSTFYIIIASIIAFSRGKKQTKIFKRAIKNDVVLKCFIIAISSFALCIISALIIIPFQKDTNFESMLFEIISAFGTVGLTLNLTPTLNIFSKIILIALMYIGRLGVGILLSSFVSKKSDLVMFSEVDFIVG